LQQRKNIQFITSSINDRCRLEFENLHKTITPTLPLIFFQKASHELMAAADVVLVTSGTATLETLLLKRPMVVAYKMANLTYKLAKHLVKLSYISLPNLLANEKLVPEFIQDAATPLAISKAILEFLDQPEKVIQLEERFLKMHLQLRCNASLKAAEAVEQLLRP
jgi:lipid-A-disaccharide synthase